MRVYSEDHFDRDSSQLAGNMHFIHTSPAGETFTIDEHSRKGMYSYEWATKQCKAVLIARSTEKTYEHIVATILFLFSESQPTIRSRVVRSLHTMLKADPGCR